ncbi:hypothetical protein [Dyadobacter sp. LHD-138]|uniref:hypothetical protein n=1 Tax=Dyadobacter sp. LHD-138 TaxID=3071413 RepID=UPI0027DFFAF4|nr:hypothetical protein [Dyadobacter sp. LHD-138]MDQ6477312.1 hypothetical protein [Dyadobacter sp. LHD-138]
MVLTNDRKISTWWIVLGAVVSIILLYPINLNKDLLVVFDRNFFIDGTLEYNCWPDQLIKASDLFHNIACPSYQPGCHKGNMAFRFTIPLLLNVFGHNGQAVYIFQLFVGIFFFYSVYRLAHTISNTQFLAAGFLLCFISTNAGQAIVYDFRAWGDAFSFMFLLFAMISKKGWLRFLFLQAAFWTDERTLVAALGIALYWLCQSTEESLKGFSNWKTVRDFVFRDNRMIVLLSCYFTYILIRMYLTMVVGLATPKEDANFSILSYYATFRTLIPIILTHKFFIVYIVIGALYLIRIRAWLVLAAYIGFIALYHLIAHMVYDTSRSMGFGYFIYFVAFGLCCRFLSEETSKKLMFANLFITLVIFPLRHIIFS